jgi:hypothetical protein
MGLLEQLRADSPGGGGNDRWKDLPQRLTDLVPQYKHGRTVLIRGEVIATGQVGTAFGPRHLYAVLHSERTAATVPEAPAFSHARSLDPPQRPAGKRPAAMGLHRYKAESETNYYTDPWVGWVDPEPDAFATWIAGIVLGTSRDTPQEERAHREKFPPKA